jgi:hypothetical protein
MAEEDLKRQQKLVGMLNSQGQQLTESLQTLAPGEPVSIVEDVEGSLELWQKMAEV